MLFPTVIFIFPAMFIVILGPAMLNLDDDLLMAPSAIRATRPSRVSAPVSGASSSGAATRKRRRPSSTRMRRSGPCRSKSSRRLPKSPVIVPVEDFGAPNGDLEAIQAELAQAIARERQARDELADLQTRLEEGFADAQSLSMRSSEVDARAAKIAAQQAQLEEREQELAQRAETAAAEQQRLAELKSELLAAEARTAAREQQISTKFRELQTVDRERMETSTELAKQAGGPRRSASERSSGQLAEVSSKAAEEAARIEARETVLATREALLREQESEVGDRDKGIAERERELDQVACDGDGKRGAPQAREAELKAKATG